MSDLKKHIKLANLNRLFNYPPHILFMKCMMRVYQYLLGFLLCFVPVILYVFNWRIQLIDVTRIGHLALTALCTINDENIDLSKLKIIVPLNGDVSNPHILKYLPKNYFFFSNRFITSIIKSISIWSFIRLPSDEYIIQPRREINAFNLLSCEYRHFELEQEDEVWLREKINAKFTLQTDWFVVIHNRSNHPSQIDMKTTMRQLITLFL